MTQTRAGQSPGKHMLVLGGYGFIGSAIVRALQNAGHHVRALGRDPAMAARVLPGVPFVQGDLREMTTEQDWQQVVENTAMVVNCAGALQDGGKDDLAAVHTEAIAALSRVCETRGSDLAQISAIGVSPDADLPFLATKAKGDQAVRDSGVRHWILRPGLVIGQTSYGGTNLLRMLAAVPWVQPMALGGVKIQCVGMADLCRAVLLAVEGKLPPEEYDLVEDQPQSLSRIVEQTRRWLGFYPARRVIHLPDPLVNLMASCADGLGRLGWRSPLRSTAIRSLSAEIVGDPEPYRSATGQGMAGLEEIFARTPADVEHRLAARVALLMPLCVAVLSLFWLASGVIGLGQLDAAAGHLTALGWSAPLSGAAVMFWSLVDIALGLAILWRPLAARACVGMIAVSGLYLLAATILTPALWLDPLGPLVKTVTAMALALVTRQFLESR